jgi:putative peptidoglycan lipid II flippase
MIGALAGKVFGFVREVLLARQLGANIVADSFRSATTAVLLPISPIQGDMVQGALVPMHRQWQRDGIAPQMFMNLSVVLGAVSIAIMMLVYVLTDYYVDWLVGGFSEQAKLTTIGLVHVMALSMPASVLFNVFACVELSVGRVRMAVIRASVQNLAVIAGIFVMVVTHNPIALGWGFAIAMIFSAMFGFVILCKEGELDPLSVTPLRCWKAGLLFIQRVYALLTQPLFEQCNIVIEKILGSMLVVGTVASLDYARTLTDTFMYFISYPIGQAVLRRDPSDQMQSKVQLLCKPILHIAVPASVFTLVFARDITIVVFQRGAFQQQAIDLVSQAMQGIGFGIWASVIGWILVRILNSQHRNPTVARIFMVAYAANALVNIATFKFLGIFGIGLGEASRGIMLLAGTAYALGCGKTLLKLSLGTLPLAMVLAALGYGICEVYHTPLWRVAIGVVAFGLVVCINMTLLFPEIVKELLRKFMHIGAKLFHIRLA